MRLGTASFKHNTAFLWLFAILIGVVPCFGNHHNKDSLLRASREGNAPRSRIEALLELCRHYNSFYTDSALQFGNEALRLSQKYHDPHFEINSHLDLSRVWLNAKKPAEARRCMEKALVVANKYGRMDDKTDIYMCFSQMFEIRGKRDSMLHYAMLAMTLADKSPNIRIQAATSHTLGKIFTNDGNYDKALEYCRKSLRLWRKAGHKNVAGLLSDIGNIFFRRQEYREALNHYEEAYENARQNNDVAAYAYILNNIGLVHYKLNETAEAVECYEKALEYYTQTLNKEGIANTLQNLSEACLKTKKYELAQQYAKTSLEYSRSMGNKEGIMSSYALLASASAGMKDYENAWRYERQASWYQDSLKMQILQQKIEDVEQKIEIEKKESEVALLRAETEQRQIQMERNNMITLLIGIITILCGTLASLAIKSNRKRRKELILLSRLNREITEQKQKLEEADEVKTKLFSIVSHDFRGPLVSLNGFLTLLKEGELEPEEIRELTGYVTEQMDTTFSFIDNLLAWAQSQLKGYKPDVTPINVYEAANTKFKLLYAQAEAKNITLCNEVNPDEVIYADTNMVRLILRNLVSNAIKFTRPGGTITVSAERQPRSITISVTDTGVGMSEENLKKIFSGQRLNTRGTAEERGTGLGLSLCREFIEKCGGRLWASSQIGKGSSFSFSIPQVTTPEKTPVPAEESLTIDR